jgi:hypothetical protein
MDDAANRYARELIEAITAAMAHDAEVQSCRAKARAAGYEINLSLEAQVKAVDRSQPAALARAAVVPPSRRLPPAAKSYDITAADRRFLRSLRIAADETAEPVE